MKKLNGLADLANFKHLFIENEDTSIPKLSNRVKKEPRLKNTHNAFEGRKKPFDNLPRDLSNRVKPQVFKLHSNLCSVKLHDEKFTNMLRTLKSCNENDVVNAIFDIKGKSYTEQRDIPFQIDESDTLIVGERHRKILMKNSVYVQNQVVYKCRYWDKVSREFNIRPKNATRVYYIKNGNEKTILLIDLYHLFATTDYNKSYPNHASYEFCMSKLRK